MRLLILWALLLCSHIAFSQLKISTSDRREASWDKAKEAWDFYSTEPITTFFDFNKDLSEFKETSLVATSAYSISKWDFDEKSSKYTMDIQTKDGKKYEMVIDGTNSFIALFYWQNEKYYMVHFKIRESDFEK